MKYLGWIGGLLLFLATFTYVMVFTPIGNALLKPLVESKINEHLKIQSTLSEFLLSMSELHVALELQEGNVVEVKGTYSLFEKNFDMGYDVNIKELGVFSIYTGSPLRGEFKTSGTVKGNEALINIEGKSDVAKSITSYHIELREFNPTSIIASVKGAKLESLLYMAAKNPYASADIDVELNFRDIRAHRMDGEVILLSKKARLDPKYMLSDFNVTIPPTSFDMKLDAKLRGDDIDYTCTLLSNLFNIGSSGKIVPQPLRADLKYSIDVDDLEVLKPLTNADIRGAVKLSGSAKGTKDEMTVIALSDLASSKTSVEAKLKEFKPAAIKAKIADLDIAKLLYMLKQPHYTDALLSLDADISDARAQKLQGKVTTSVKKGVLDSAYLTKRFAFASPMPKTVFNMSSLSVLKGSIVDTAIELNSNMAGLNVKSAKYDIKDASLASDYRVDIGDLDKLFFVTQRRLKGSITATGDVSKAKDLDFTMNGAVAGGELKAKLHNNDFSAELSSISAIKVLEMLLYPQIADAVIEAKVNYDLSQSRGVMRADIKNALFVKNNTFDLIKQYTKIDMYREYFNGKAEAKIEKENILANIDLSSKEASIKTQETKLNTKTNTIDTDVTLTAKKNVIEGSIKGDISSPKVSVDLDKLMKSEAKKVIEKEVDKLFKKLF